MKKIALLISIFFISPCINAGEKICANIEENIVYDECSIQGRSHAAEDFGVIKIYYYVLLGIDKFGAEPISEKIHYDYSEHEKSRSEASAKRAAYRLGQELVKRGICRHLKEPS